jgi:hypothetical protein
MCPNLITNQKKPSLLETKGENVPAVKENKKFIYGVMNMTVKRTSTLNQSVFTV